MHRDRSAAVAPCDKPGSSLLGLPQALDEVPIGRVSADRKRDLNGVGSQHLFEVVHYS